MRDLISAKFPDHGIFGEEEGMQQPKSSDTQYLWVLDPIDGTKSFITGTQHQQALLNPETSILIQKRHSYTRNLNSETPGDSKITFLHCGDVLGQHGTQHSGFAVPVSFASCMVSQHLYMCAQAHQHFTMMVDMSLIQ